jgi:Peptidase C13 family
MQRSSWANMLRLWGLMNVHAAPSLRCSAMAALFWLAVWCGLDWFFAQPDPEFFLANTPLLAWYALAILALAGILRWRSTPTPSFAAAFALAVGAIPVPLLLAGVAAAYLTTRSLLGWSIVAAVYGLIYLARGLRSITGQPQRVAALCGIVFLVGFMWASDALDVIPDVWATPEFNAPTSSTDEALADAEGILFDQAGRIDRLLADIKLEPSVKPKAFFVGFAGVGDEKVFTQEIGLASRVLGERYDIGNRSLSLINDERDLERAPLASVSALRYALHGMGQRMNVDRDVLFLSISSHGSQDPAIAVSNSQLPFNDMTDRDLAEALRQSGIKWRVIIISACYAGGFIDSLKSPTTAVITAAAADRTSFGCGTSSDLTYFGEAFYRDALPEAKNLREAFDRAKAAIAVRERRERQESSKPQVFFGAQVEAKLASMDAPAP